MPLIEIDLESYKKLVLLRENEQDTDADVIRKILSNYPISYGDKRNKSNDAQADEVQASGSWFSRGVEFPAGTKFRGVAKGQTIGGVVKDGALVIGGKKQKNLSDAASRLLDYPINGWVFWQVLLPGEREWVQAKKLRLGS